jgi:hypothetical protein
VAGNVLGQMRLSRKLEKEAGTTENVQAIKMVAHALIEKIAFSQDVSIRGE